MGFPTWTLWGMGLAAVAALIAIALSFIGQTPRLTGRLGLSGLRLDLRARNLTGYGLALLLLALGFFLAGVPLGAPETGAAGVDGDSSAILDADAGDDNIVAGTIVPVETPTLEEAIASSRDEVDADSNGSDSSTGAMGDLGPGGEPGTTNQSGAFFPPTRPPVDAGDVLTATGEITATIPVELVATGVAEGNLAEPVASAVPSATPEATPTATLFPTVTPTPTPELTLTPTPIFEPTARVGENTSTLVLRRTPGGAQLSMLVRGDTVIPQAGRAFHSGSLWRQISTVDGVVGWVQDVFLDYGNAGSE